MESRQQPQVPVYREASRLGEPVSGTSREREHVFTSLTQPSPILSALVDFICCVGAAASNEQLQPTLERNAVLRAVGLSRRGWAAALYFINF